VQGVQLHYRAYHLDHVGHIQSVSEFECITDEERSRNRRNWSTASMSSFGMAGAWSPGLRPGPSRRGGE
jgi:hypothetical protein